MRLALLILAASLASAQATVSVHITTSHESISSLYPILHTKAIGLHTVRICNDIPGAPSVWVPPEMIFQALVNLPSMTVERAEILINDSYNHNKKLVIVRVIEYGVIIATFVVSGGLITASGTAISALGLTIPLAQMLGDKLKGEVPSLASVLDKVLTDDVQLQAAGVKGYCATRTIFTPVIASANLRDYDVRVNVPTGQPAPVAPQVIPPTTTQRQPLSDAPGVIPRLWTVDTERPEETGLAAMRGGWGRQTVEVASR